MNDRRLIIEDGIVAGNAYDKYGTGNPLARVMVNGFMNSLLTVVKTTGAREVHEIGCGEGHVSLRLFRQGLKVRGSDFSTRVIAEAKQNAKTAGASIAFEVASIYDLHPPQSCAELIVCCEVLEHLPDPEKALDVLANLARPHLIASVPREPIWRALNISRGKYLKALGNTPGHLNHWSSKSFLKFLRRRFEVIECHQPFPWTMVWCRPKD
jgi:2-polyprenyl-3-methyl-5-hydroxy-6-metoxy-1,4-benzoquinol methylase